MAKGEEASKAKNEAKNGAKNGKSAKPAQQAANSAKPAAAKGQDEGFSLAGFFQGTKDELGKVVWPSRQQLISESAAVILMVGLSATVIYLVDNLLGWVSKQVFG